MSESSGINLCLIDDSIPVLPSGALDGVSTDPSEKHMAARVRFSEIIYGAWNERKNMLFMLPDGVVFRKVEFSRFKGFNTQSALETGRAILNTGQRVSSDTGMASIRLLGGTLTINGLERKPKEFKSLPSLDFRAWLSIAPDYSGDVKLQASAFPGKLGEASASCSVIIAKAAPVVSIETIVSSVSIGTQQSPTSEIFLRESRAGALGEGQRVELSIGEASMAGIASDVCFASGATVAVDEGNLRIKNVMVRNGLLRFDIERESSVSSLVRISNLGVCLTRSVPETNTHPLQLIVGGSAIAANSRYARAFDKSPYEIQDPNSGGAVLSLDRELFETRGISSDYLWVKTPNGSP